MQIGRTIDTEVLVVGSGLSGIRVTKELAEKEHNVLMVTKTHLASGSSFFPLKASLGTQVTKDKEDASTFYEDIAIMSRGMHDQKLAETYINEIPEAASEYKDIGVNATKLKDERKACFAKNPRDIYLLSDWNATRDNVREIFGEFDNIDVILKTSVVTLIVKDARVTGVVLIDQDNEFVHVNCKSVILGTGGFGSIYKHNLNPNDVEGSGHILAMDAGAELVNMEFIQFIPGITSPKYKTLFGEHTLMYCKDIVDEAGESIVERMLPEGMDKRELMEIRSTHGPFTHTLKSRYFDIAMMDRIIDERKEDGFRLIFDDKLYETDDQFYTVYLDWLKKKGIDMVNDEVRIAPFAHASNGGVHIDIDGRTGVAGLYAIGELSSNVEGANRLGGNSTGACMVFGKRAAMSCDEYLSEPAARFIGSSDEDAVDALQKFIGRNGGESMAEDSLEPSVIIKEIQRIMWYRANVVRDEESLLAGISEIDILASKFNLNEAFGTAKKKSAVKAANFLRLSKMLLSVMLQRQESRGAHYRSDYPEESEKFDRRLYVKTLENGKLEYTFSK